ncbi:AI-2E family transporter [Porticoccaceae bacterium]|nr:AI-2E family transporter [Porticoccaceae bacterium]MDB9970146.1 AI-2E family transporter [Porticoccaceae bacterium]MDC0010901.1 AI-2E family transporter [Porticoccaceae bacterium]MDC1453387.1 AI-2E family transporter [Porticoccaceae bacterium]
MKKILHKWIERYFGTEEALLLTIILIVSLIVFATLGAVLGPVFAALILSFLLQGVVNMLVRHGVPRVLALVSTYLLFVAGFVSVIVGLIPIIGRQTSLLIGELPNMIAGLRDLAVALPERYAEYVSPEQFQSITQRLSEEVGRLLEQALSFSISSFPGIIGVMIYLVLVPLLVMFMLKDKDQLLLFLSNLLPEERSVMRTIWNEMDMQFTNYVRGKAIEILIIGLVSYAVFLWLGVNYAALLALLVGLSVLVPYIGATVVTIPVLLVGYMQWGFSNDFFWLFGAYGVIQFLDGNLLVPLLFSEVVNLHPVFIIVSVLLFGGIWGFWGVFFAIPLATLVKAVFNAWPRRAQQELSLQPPLDLAPENNNETSHNT